MSLFPHTADASRVPDEHQLTVLLATLLSADVEAARRFAWVYSRAGAILQRDADATNYCAAVLAADRIDVEYQIPLPLMGASGLPTTTMRPDLSIAGWSNNRPAFQLLVEAKLYSAFSTRRIGSAELLQPAAYAVAWEQMPRGSEAPIRRVGTLTWKKLRSAEAQWIADVEASCVHVQPSRADVDWLTVELLIDDLATRRTGPIAQLADRVAGWLALEAQAGATGGSRHATLVTLSTAAHGHRKQERRELTNHLAGINDPYPCTPFVAGASGSAALSAFLQSLGSMDETIVSLVCGVHEPARTFEEAASKLGWTYSKLRTELRRIVDALDNRGGLASFP